MSKEIPAYIIIQRMGVGDNKAFTAFYKENRAPFFRHFIIRCQEDQQAGFVRMKFKDNDMYLDDLYQTSCIRLYEKVNFGKLYADGEKVMYVNRYGEKAPLTCSLITLLKNIGSNVLREMERDHQDDTQDIDEVVRTTEEGESAPDSLIAEDGEEDLKITIARELVLKMTDPCRKIFHALYGTGDSVEAPDTKVKGVDIYESLGYSSAESFRNQRSRCNKKFKAAFLDAFNKAKK